VERSSTTQGLPVAPALGPSLEAARVPIETRPIDRRVVWLCGASVVLAIAAGFVAQGLAALIALLTNLAYFGRLSTSPISPGDHHLGPWQSPCRWRERSWSGSWRVTVEGDPRPRHPRGDGAGDLEPEPHAAADDALKPLSSAVAIGTGGPFGAEGPIIATGGALGSLVGQLLRTTANERKTLLAAGAAAGMAATFGTPVAAVLLAVELLLFEFRARSIIPVALAACTAAAVRIAFAGHAPAFAMPDIDQPGSAALACYVAIGALAAVAAVGVTRAVYFVEDAFEKLPIHWMWWPAIGGLAVGLVGLVAPRTLGVGYDNIEDALAGRSALAVIAALCAWKFVSWVIALGSGTSGGTLAPLLTMGGGLGAALGAGFALVLPSAGVDPRIAALVGWRRCSPARRARRSPRSCSRSRRRAGRSDSCPFSAAARPRTSSPASSCGTRS
jgi:hypothetical protein